MEGVIDELDKTRFLSNWSEPQPTISIIDLFAGKSDTILRLK